MATNKEQTSGGMMPDKDRPGPELSRPLRYVVIYLCLAVAMLLSGLQHFVLTLPSASGKQLQYTDGIVVMTGGQQRLDDCNHGRVGLAPSQQEPVKLCKVGSRTVYILGSMEAAEFQPEHWHASHKLHKDIATRKPEAVTRSKRSIEDFVV